MRRLAGNARRTSRSIRNGGIAFLRKSVLPSKQSVKKRNVNVRSSRNVSAISEALPCAYRS